jgi:hypothetical protein
MYRDEMNSNGMVFIPSFSKVSQLVVSLASEKKNLQVRLEATARILHFRNEQGN